MEEYKDVDILNALYNKLAEAAKKPQTFTRENIRKLSSFKQEAAMISYAMRKFSKDRLVRLIITKLQAEKT